MADPDPGQARRSYELGVLREGDLAPTWREQLARWLSDAAAAGLPEPGAMVLATAGTAAVPGARTVLLRELEERGITFYTNYGSRKGRELAENPRAAAVFPFLGMQRQVVVDATVTRLSSEESDAYFASRPWRSRLSALASAQSQVLPSREALEEGMAAAEAAYPEEVPRPEGWGGYLITPLAVEFWQGRRDRLHDRLRFRRSDGGAWVVERLAP